MRSFRSSISLTKGKAQWSLLALLAMLAVCHARSTAWHRKDAFARIKSSPMPSNHQSMRVDLPDGIAEVQSVVAFAGARSIPLRPIRLDGRIISVELCPPPTPSPQPGQARIPYPTSPVYVYLLANGKVQTHSVARPVVCRMALEKVVARPGTAQEMVQYNRTHSAMSYFKSLASMPTSSFRFELLQRMQQLRSHMEPRDRKQKNKVRFHASVMYHVEVSVKARFAITNRDSGPWYLLCNGQPVFSWASCVEEEGIGLTSPQVALNKGLNRLDFFSFTEFSEAFPLLSHSLEDEGRATPIHPQYLFTTFVSDSCVLEFPNGKTVDLSTRFDKGFYLREIKRNAWVTTQQGKRTWFFPSKPVFKREGFARTLYPDPTTTEQASVRISLEEMPFFEPVEELPWFRYALKLQGGVAPYFYGQANLTLRSYDKAGELLATVDRGIASSPFKRTVACARPTMRLHRTDVAVTIDGEQVSNTIRLYSFRPGDALDFKGYGGRLMRYKDGFAMVQRLRGKLDCAPVSVKHGRMLLIDDFIAHHPHPYEDAAIEALKWEKGWTVQHLPICNAPLSKQHPLMEKLSALKRAGKNPPDLLVLACGSQDLQSGMDLRDYREQTVMLMRIAASAGIPIALVTIPDSGNVKRGRLRAPALAIKELGESYGVPVVDLYSASVRQKVSKFWEVKGYPGLRCATPDREGRQWVADRIMQTISNWKQRK